MPRKRTTPPPTADAAATDAAPPAVSPRRHRDVEGFLRSVVLGGEPASLAQRIRAAGVLLRASPAHASDVPPRERARRAAMDAESVAREEWRARSDAIRLRLKEAKT